MKLCVVGGLRCLVMLDKCDPNRSRGYGAVGVEIGHSYYFGQWLVTTACTAVQAVINKFISTYLICSIYFRCLIIPTLPTKGNVKHMIRHEYTCIAQRLMLSHGDDAVRLGQTPKPPSPSRRRQSYFVKSESVIFM